MNQVVNTKRAKALKFMLFAYTFLISTFFIVGAASLFLSNRSLANNDTRLVEPQAVPVPGFNCGVESTNGPLNWNFNCSQVDTTKQVTKVAVFCEKQNQTFCAPINDGQPIHTEGPMAPFTGVSAFNIPVEKVPNGGTCGMIQVDLMVGGSFETDVIVGAVSNLGQSDCKTNEEPPTPEPTPTPSLSIEKTLITNKPNKTFDLDESAKFRINLVNDGNVRFDKVRFVDAFDNQYIALAPDLAGNVGTVRYRKAGQSTFTEYNINVGPNSPNAKINANNGNLVINDVNEIVGINFFHPGDSYVFRLNFTTEKVTVGEPETNFLKNDRTINYGRATGTTEDNKEINVEANDRLRIVDADANGPSVEISKQFAQGFTNSFQVGDDIGFDIQIRNNGTVNLDVVEFIDNYDPTFIDYQNGTVTFPNGTSRNIPNGRVDEAVGRIQINDLTSATWMDANLAPGQVIRIRLNYKALASTANEPNGETINVAIVNSDGLTDEDDQNVIIEDVVIPGEKDVRIIKELAPGQQNPVEVGENVTFMMTITNTGDQTLEVVSFEDNYLTNYLDYVSGQARFGSTTINFSNMNGFAVDENAGRITIADLTSGSNFNRDLDPNESITLFITFQATQSTTNLPVNESINEAIVRADEEEDDDDEDIEITDPSEDPILDVDKFLANRPDGRPYRVGEEVIFQIRVENLSTTRTFDVVEFIDNFDSTYLQLNLADADTYIIKNSTGARFDDVEDVATTPNANSFRIADLTDPVLGLGDLGPNDWYDIFVSFTALRSTVTNNSTGFTVNTAIANADELRGEDDEIVVIIDDEEPVVAACNEACGGNVICGNGLACLNGVCRLPSNPSSLTCEEDNQNERELDVEKVLVNRPDGRPYRVGEEIIFQIRIENVSEDRSFDVVRLEDTFDPTYLQLNIDDLDTYIVKSNGQRFDDVASVATVTNNSFVIADLTNPTLGLGDTLAPGEWFDVFVSFTALRSTVTNASTSFTTNYAVAQADDEEDDDDEDVVIIDDNDIEVVGCNETCGGNIVCDTNQGLFCATDVNRCRLVANPSSQTCQGQVGNNPDLSISKSVVGSSTITMLSPFEFEIRIRNTGDVELSTVRFRDDYDPSVLSYQGGRLEKRGANNQVIGSISNINSLLNINDRTNGLLEISNLVSSTGLGNLQPGEYYVIRLRFTGLRPGSTRNVAITEGRTPGGEQTPTEDDDAVINFNNLNTDL